MKPALKLVKRVRVTKGTSHFREPVIAHDAVYAGSENQELVKFDRASLEPEWRIPSSGFQSSCAIGELVLQHSFSTSEIRAVRQDGTVAWILGPKGRCAWERWGDHLYSVDLTGGVDLVDASTGQRSECVPIETRRGEVSWGCYGDILLLRQEDEHEDLFRAFDMRRRRFLWERPLLADIRRQYAASRSSPSFTPGSHDRVIGQIGSGVVGVDLRQGKLLWCVMAPPDAVAVDRGRVYVWSRSDDMRQHRCMCLDETTGQIVYDVPYPAKPFIWPAPALSGRFIVYAQTHGFIGAFLRSDGSLVWSHECRRGIGGAPVIAGNRLFIAGADGQLAVYAGDMLAD